MASDDSLELFVRCLFVCGYAASLFLVLVSLLSLSVHCELFMLCVALCDAAAEGVPAARAGPAGLRNRLLLPRAHRWVVCALVVLAWLKIAQLPSRLRVLPWRYLVVFFACCPMLR
jgi:hypothetical protein